LFNPSESPLSNTLNTPITMKVKIFGIGGGACNIIRSFPNGHDTNPELIAVYSNSSEKILLGRFKTTANLLIGDGSGTNADPACGSKAAEDSSAELKAHLQGANLVILIACMGGGTGTGATPVIARLARECGAYVAAICTIPFNREGQLRQQKAADGIEQLKGQADLLVTIPNEFIFTTEKPAPGILDMFKQMDELVLQVSQEILQKYETGGIAEIQATIPVEGASCFLSS